MFGNAEKTPICITGLNWLVSITDTHIRIGCECHSAKEWKTFSNGEIIKMDDQAIKFWDDHKKTIIDLAKIHQDV